MPHPKWVLSVFFYKKMGTIENWESLIFLLFEVTLPDTICERKCPFDLETKSCEERTSPSRSYVLIGPSMGPMYRKAESMNCPVARWESSLWPASLARCLKIKNASPARPGGVAGDARVHLPVVATQNLGGESIELQVARPRVSTQRPERRPGWWRPKHAEEEETDGSMQIDDEQMERQREEKQAGVKEMNACERDPRGPLPCIAEPYLVLLVA